MDGDTLWALINVGFGTVLRKKLRMHGLDAREIKSPEGKEACDYVKRLLPRAAPIVVRSYASDAFGRFLADIFYSPDPDSDPHSPATFKRILKRGIFLNQELLGKGLAVRVRL